jgi:hypothetical protein
VEILGLNLLDPRAGFLLLGAPIIAGLLAGVVYRGRRRLAERRRIEAALRASEMQLRRESELLQMIIDRLPVMLTVYDPNTQNKLQRTGDYDA